MNTTGRVSGNSPRPASQTYAAALVLIGNLIPLPLVATILTAVLYISPISPALVGMIPTWIATSWVICLAGFVLTLIYWLLFALPFRGFSALESAIPVIGGELKNHFLTVRANFNALLSLEDTSTSTHLRHDYGYHMASEQIKSYLAELETLLYCEDMRWIAGVGYLSAWRLVHSAEEAMIAIMPREEVIREAFYDELCLEDSNIATRNAALKKLRRAVASLSSSASAYLDAQQEGVSDQSGTSSNGAAPLPGNDQADPAPSRIAAASNNTSAPANRVAAAASQTASDNVTQGDAGEPAATTAPETSVSITEEPGNSPVSHAPVLTSEQPASANGTAKGRSALELEARGALRDVRRTINEYRDGLWEGLVTIRNQLMGSALITALSTYVLLGIAIIAGAAQSSILAATIFYSVGALVGLFGRLYIESQAERATDDYDLTLARIIVTPLLAGLAAVGGVPLMAMLSLTLLKTPGAPVTNAQMGLGATYNLTSNELGIVIAAVFGLTPNLFINILQSKAKNITDQLQSSTPTNQ